MTKEPAIHDYTKRYWGHDYTFEPIDGGMKGRMMGWGSGIEKGDFLLLDNEGQSTRYLVRRIEYFQDPPDMWRIDAVFAPRPRPE